ncbi:MAG: hypothetical protein HFG69_11300 [Hungatella sp.]|nr:hypothetical protein [Hungatella sp.]
MYKFAIKNKVYHDKTVAWLFYDEEKKEYEIRVPEDTKSNEAPLIIAAFIEKNQRVIGKEWSLRWVRERVIPPDRQNIGQILRENNMKFYDEFPLLVSNQGRSGQPMRECHNALPYLAPPPPRALATSR